MLLVILICHIPIVNRGLNNVNSSLFSTIWQWRTSQKTGVGVSYCLHWSKNVHDDGIQWLVVKPRDLLHRAMRTVTYRCIAMAIKTASRAGVFFHRCLFDCCPGSRWGDTERVVARWRLPGASSVWLWICCTGRCHMHRFNASAWPSNDLLRRHICSLPLPFSLTLLRTMVWSNKTKYESS